VVKKPRSKRGFAAMDRERQREIASKGGKRAHQKGTAHQWTADEGREAGRKGGEAVSRDREHMAMIGRAGAAARAQNSKEAKIEKRSKKTSRTARVEKELSTVPKADWQDFKKFIDEKKPLIIQPPSQLIIGNREDFKRKVLGELEKGQKSFLIDFLNTGYIDSSGLGVLVSCSKKVRERGGEMRLANLTPDLRTLFELTKLDSLFYIYDTQE
jgi:anti-anti-sigma factor